MSERISQFIVILIVTAGCLMAQSGQGEIAGIIKDPSGAGVPAAPVLLVNQDSGVSRAVKSESDGRYLFAALPPGRYSLKIEASGFKPVTVTDIEIVLGAHIDHDVSMTVGNVTEVVTVSGEVPLIDTTNADVGGVVSQIQINSLPVNTRQYLNLATLLPGTTQDASRSFYNSVQLGGGDHYYANGFQVDGVTNTWAEMGEPRQNFPE